MDEAGTPIGMKKRRLKRELRVLAERQRNLERAQRQLAVYAEVVAVAVHSPALVPVSDLQAAIAGIHELAAIGSETKPHRMRVAA